MNVKQQVGLAIIVIILACTIVSIAGIWGFIGTDEAWQIFATLVVCAIGLGSVGKLVDIYFKDKPIE